MVHTKQSQIAKLRSFVPIVVDFPGVTDTGDIGAVRAMIRSIEKSQIRGTYVNRESGVPWSVGGNAIKRELVHHSYERIEHWQSFVAIPDIIAYGIYAGYLPNSDRSKNPLVDRFEYYLSEVLIQGKTYTVKTDVVVDEQGNRRYYDHNLEDTKIEQLLISPQAISSARVTNIALPSINDKRLRHICQALFEENSQKILF
jgi:hypothetical protein